MKKGFTTGTCAAAAAKAHGIFLVTGKVPPEVEVIMPNDSTVLLQVQSCSANGASVIKDAGDDPDITHGAEICAFVEINDSSDIKILGGIGVGKVTKSGLQIPVGEPAINPVPREMIKENLTDIGVTGCSVTISVPEGEKLAEQTFNSRIGILGGISIIGSTGIVEPMSLDSLLATIECEIDVQTENGAEELFLVPGKIGEKHLSKLIPHVQTVIMSNYVGHALEYSLSKGFKKITLAGHPGKLAKIAMGYYNTHSKESPMAQNYLAGLLGLGGDYNTVEEICAEIDEMHIAASEISKAVKEKYGFDKVSVILFDMSGALKGRHDA